MVQSRPPLVILVTIVLVLFPTTQLGFSQTRKTPLLFTTSLELVDFPSLEIEGNILQANHLNVCNTLLY